MTAAALKLLGQRRPSRELLLDPDAEQHIEESRDRAERRLDTRERRVERAFAVAFVAASAAMMALIPWGRPLSMVPALTLVAGYAVVSRIKFEVGPCYTNPTQLLLVPMLFFLPAPCVPAAVALGNLLGEVPDYLWSKRHPERALVSLADSWYAVGPALVLGLAAVGHPQLEPWPILLAALAAQFAADAATTTPREWLELGISPREQLPSAGWTFAVDALLAPIGLAAAVAAQSAEATLLLVLPLALLFTLFARERSQRMDSALRLSGAYRGTTLLLAELVESDDEYTGVHSQGVVELSLQVGEQLGLTGRRRRTLEFGAMLHDVGKISVPKEIINKPGPLTDQEWEVMKGHTVYGQRMLDRVGGDLGEVGRIIRASHERWDGDGYPDGLSGDAIPVEARIVSCCDAFNAMTTDRSYRDAMSADEALKQLAGNAGTQFDPEVARVVIALVAEETPTRVPVPA